MDTSELFAGSWYTMVPELGAATQKQPDHVSEALPRIAASRRALVFGFVQRCYDPRELQFDELKAQIG